MRITWSQKMAILYKQRIINEWIFCVIILIILFITFLTTFIFFSECNRCSDLVVLVQIILVCSIITTLFYLLGFTKRIEADRVIGYLSKYEFFKNIQLGLLFLVFGLMIKIHYVQKECNSEIDKSIEFHKCNVQISCKDSIHLESQKDTLIIREIIKKDSAPILIKPIVTCSHENICKHYSSFDPTTITNPIVEESKRNADVVIKSIQSIKRDTIVFKDVEQHIYNYSIDKLKVKTKKSITSLVDSANNLETSIQNQNIENQKIKSKKVINQ